ncbi:MAG: hypothetical protein JST16_03780 [Bdellovibrionales bacterium]|nr:hypothetical protein [Bdellovibrionales bacterium]
MTELRTSTVHRNLDAKLKIVGMEVHDLLFVLLFASIMNLIFGKTGLALYLVFLLPMLMAGVLFIAKRNKPDRYLIHLIRYQLSPGFYSSGELGAKYELMRRKIYKN